MRIVFLTFWIPILAYISFSVLYQVSLALVYFLVEEKPDPVPETDYRFALLIPAHNEEAIIGRLLESLKSVDYPSRLLGTTVVADNCDDGTVQVASQYDVDVLARKDPARRGKGFAIRWALERIDLESYDALVIVDADNVLAPGFFRGLGQVLARGYNAVQCNNCLANWNQSSFTAVIHLSRTINNLLYHYAKYKLGLSSYLMGNGMCFTTKLLKEHGWVSSTMAEDYEYYAELVQKNEMIGFAVNSCLYHQESTGIRCATQQRLRWSSGRFQIARKYGFQILKQGIRQHSLRIIDASFPLILPNLSLLANLSTGALILSILTYPFYKIAVIPALSAVLLVLVILYFSAGLYLTRMSLWRFARAIGFAPIFLLWKGCIDFKGILGRGVSHWGRSQR